MILIDDQVAFPIKKEGILLKPGTFAKIILSKTTSIDLPLPYNDCHDAPNIDTLLSREMARYGYAYTRRNCMTFCEQKFIIDKLGCYDLRLPAILNATPCDTRDKFNSIRYIKFNFSSCSNQCPFECTAVRYDVSISYDDFPTSNYYWDLYMEKGSVHEILGDISSSFLDFKASVASVYIYYDELKYTEMTNLPAMLLPDLIANIGGLMGLFVGISLLSFIEFFELIINFFIIYYRKRQKRKIERNTRNGF